MSADRRIDPDFAEGEPPDLRRIIREELRARQPVEVMSYSEGPRDLAALCYVLKWCAGIAAGLAVAGIIGAVVMYGNQQALREEVAALRHDFDDFKKLVEPRYRGGEDADASGG